MEEVPAEAAGQSPYTLQVSSCLLLHGLSLYACMHACMHACVSFYLSVLSVRVTMCLSICVKVLAHA